MVSDGVTYDPKRRHLLTAQDIADGIATRICAANLLGGIARGEVSEEDVRKIVPIEEVQELARVSM